MLLDDAGDPGLRTLEMMAVEAIGRGWQGRALAHHCRAMSLYPMPYVQRLARVLKTARVSVVTDPHTGPLHALVKELLAEDITVCLGQDDVSVPIIHSAATTCWKSPFSLRTCCG